MAAHAEPLPRQGGLRLLVYKRKGFSGAAISRGNMDVLHDLESRLVGPLFKPDPSLSLIQGRHGQVSASLDRAEKRVLPNPSMLF